MSIWAAVRGAAGNYLQQEDARKAAEAEAERIRKKEEMAAALREETYAREDMRDQRAAERERDREMRDAEIAERNRLDMLEGRNRDDDRADQQLELTRRQLGETSLSRKAQQTANSLAAEERATAKAAREADRAEKEMQKLVDAEVSKYQASKRTPISYEKRMMLDDEIRAVTRGADNKEAVLRAVRQILAEGAWKADGTTNPNEAVNAL